MSSPPLLEIQAASKSYGQRTIFRDVSLSVGGREIVAIVGASGCGKTTLLRCIDGLITLSGGRIRANGATVDAPWPGAAMVFQHFGLFPWKNVAANVAYGLRMAGIARAEIAERVAECIHLVGLDGFEKAWPHQLSGGMQQRCGLARALALQPQLLLMDEPFGAIDAQTREILQFELLRIWGQRPTAMVFVTHAIDEAVLMGHRVVVLKGRPSSIGTIIEIDLPHPRTRATLALPRFVELREQVWLSLRDEALAAQRELGT